MDQRIYLDNNAGAFLDPRVRERLIQAIQTPLGNPSSVHFFGQKVRNQISFARQSIASFLGVQPSEVVFNSGGTEGMNFAIRGLLSHYSSGHIITSEAEHSCVYSTVKEMEGSGFSSTFLQPGLLGAPSPEAVYSAIQQDTCLIVLMAVNNETGVKTDIDAIASIAADASIPFVVDGVALLGKEPFKIPKGVSVMSFSGHKVHAPQGIGVSFVRSGVKLKQQITGGEQEFGRRAGTENVLGILGLAKAIELLAEELPQASHQMLFLRNKFEETLLKSLPNISINGKGERTVNVSNVQFTGVDGEALLVSLDAAGVAASHGSACSSGALEPSRVLLGMGISLQAVRSSLRFSISRFTTENDIKEACEIIIRQVRQMRKIT